MESKLLFRYKGYEIQAHYSASVSLYYAEVINCKDLIAFQAKDILSLKELSTMAIDNYINTVSNKEYEF